MGLGPKTALTGAPLYFISGLKQATCGISYSTFIAQTPSRLLYSMVSNIKTSCNILRIMRKTLSFVAPYVGFFQATAHNGGILCKTPLVFRYDNQLITISHSSMMVLQPCKYTSSRTTRRRTWLSSAFSMHTTPNYIKLGGRPIIYPNYYRYYTYQHYIF